MFESSYLANLPRKELQALAKENGLKANSKNADLIVQLLELSDNSDTTPSKEFSQSMPVTKELARTPVSRCVDENVSNVAVTPPSSQSSMSITKSTQKSSLKARFQTQTVLLQVVSTPPSDVDDDDYSPQPSGSTAKKVVPPRTSLGRMSRINTPLAAVVAGTHPTTEGKKVSPPATMTKKEMAPAPKAATPKQGSRKSKEKRRSSVQCAAAAATSATPPANNDDNDDTMPQSEVTPAAGAADGDFSCRNGNGGITPNLLSEFVLEQEQTKREAEAKTETVTETKTETETVTVTEAEAEAEPQKTCTPARLTTPTPTTLTSAAAGSITEQSSSIVPRESIEAWAAVLDDEEEEAVRGTNGSVRVGRVQQSANSNTLDAPTAMKAPRPTAGTSIGSQEGEGEVVVSPTASSSTTTPRHVVIPSSWSSDLKMSPTAAAAEQPPPASSSSSSSSSSSKRPLIAAAKHSTASSALQQRRMSSSTSAPGTPAAAVSRHTPDRSFTPQSAVRQSCPTGSSLRAARASPSMGIDSTSVMSKATKGQKVEALARKLAVYTTSPPTDSASVPAHVAPLPLPKMTKAVALMTAARQAKAVAMERKALADTAAAKPGLRLETKRNQQPAPARAAATTRVAKGPTKHSMVPSCASIRPAARPASPEATSFKARAMPSFKAVTVTMNKASVVAAAAIAAPPKYGGLGKPAAPIAVVLHRAQHAAHDPKENAVPAPTASRVSTAPKTFKLSSSNRGVSAAALKTSSEAEAKAKTAAAPLSPLHNAMDNTAFQGKARKGQKTPCKNPFEAIAM